MRKLFQTSDVVFMFILHESDCFACFLAREAPPHLLFLPAGDASSSSPRAPALLHKEASDEAGLKASSHQDVSLWHWHHMGRVPARAFQACSDLDGKNVQT